MLTFSAHFPIGFGIKIVDRAGKAGVVASLQPEEIAARRSVTFTVPEGVVDIGFEPIGNGQACNPQLESGPEATPYRHKYSPGPYMAGLPL
jgi:hypothetical protein